MTVEIKESPVFFHTPKVMNLTMYVGDWGGGFPACEVCGVTTDEVWVGEYRFSGHAYRSHRCERHWPTDLAQWKHTDTQLDWRGFDALMYCESK